MAGKRIQEIRFLAFSICIGMLAAAGALLFRFLIVFFQHLFWGGGETFLDRVSDTPWWLVLLIPTAGGLLAGPIITFFVPEAKGPGVPEVIASVVRQHPVRRRVTYLKALVSSLLIGAGASVGREGPIVQIGAAIGSAISGFFGLSPEMGRVYLACGAAAGIAATFNAPIAGTLFAVEIILFDVEIGFITYIVVSSVVASVISRLLYGDFPTFQITGFRFAHYGELIIFLLLGLAAGLVAIVFVKTIFKLDGFFDRLRLPEWLKPALGGLLLGIMALKLPMVLGVGYDSINLALGGNLQPIEAAGMLVFKIAATALCIGSGMSGGIFAPSLVVGAALGTLVGGGAQLVLPAMHLQPSDYALVGMGALVAGTTLAPITAILTIFELTYSNRMMLPLMVACIASVTVVRLLFGYSAYEIKLLRRGINIVRGHDISLLRSLKLRSIMTRKYESLLDSTSLETTVNEVLASSYPHFIVLNEAGELAGVLSLRDVRLCLTLYDDLKDIVLVVDLMTREVITVRSDDNLETAFSIFEQNRISFLPVVDPDNEKRVVGIVKKEDLFQAYRQRVLRDRSLSCPV